MVFCLTPVCASHGKMSSILPAASQAFLSGLPSITMGDVARLTSYLGTGGWAYKGTARQTIANKRMYYFTAANMARSTASAIT